MNDDRNNAERLGFKIRPMTFNTKNKSNPKQWFHLKCDRNESFFTISCSNDLETGKNQINLKCSNK
ncbi:hypothetical protein DERP_008143 [Dermatophagoides pteronyssinus]|uniref:Uncharacterized protein n=1 Tax=Dermatophagoides pteronyssinus TaxID=6956 RepID=A0ABQ8JKE9_DERPT|nr:hypothetical protein DERP_008143 [Dermatophagoides pteronyssinus]